MTVFSLVLFLILFRELSNLRSLYTTSTEASPYLILTKELSILLTEGKILNAAAANRPTITNKLLNV